MVFWGGVNILGAAMFRSNKNRIVLFCTALMLSLAGNTLASGDPNRGKEFATDCAACHGADGNSPSPAFPIIAGQHEQYLYSALQAYRDRRRDNAIMGATIIGLSDQQLQDLAAWFATQKGLGGLAGESGQVAAAATASGALLAEGGSDVEAGTSGLPDEAQCPVDNNSDEDSDGDGLANSFDAKPYDANEFVLDTNEDGRYEICSIQQLQAILTLVESADGSKGTKLSLTDRLARDYELVRDIDAVSIESFIPIGNCGPTGNCMNDFDKYGFKGSFDGRGHVISNLTISMPDSGGVGLFGVISRGKVVRNIELNNANITGRAGTGTVVGVNFGTVFNCHATGTVQGKNAIGGLVGANGANISFSHASVNVTGEMAVGGLVGDQNKNVFASYADGDVSGNNGVGGLVGLNTRGRVVSSYAIGSATGNENVGGLVGLNTDALLTNSYATGSVNGSKLNAGGLVGFNSKSRIINAYSSGYVNGNMAVGGVVGNNNGVIAQSYTLSEVKGQADVGGLVGKNADGEILSSYWGLAATGQLQASGTREGDISGASALQIAALSRLSVNDTDWNAVDAAATVAEANYCDTDGSGEIEAAEQVATNFAWDLRAQGQLPALRCTPGGVAQQHR